MTKREWVIDPNDGSVQGVRLTNYNPDDVGRLVEIKPAERDALQGVIEALGELTHDIESPQATMLFIQCAIAGKILERYQAAWTPPEWKPKGADHG